MVRNHGKVSLAFLRGDREINAERPRKKVKTFADLTDDEEREIRLEAFRTGETFTQVLKRKEDNQTNLEGFKNGVKD